MIDLDALERAAAAAPRPTFAALPVDDMVAPINYAPKAWQATLAQPTGWKPAVVDSPDLQRILALPRRPVPDGIVTPAREGRDEVRTPLGEAFVGYVNGKLRKPPGPCRCAAIQADLGIKPRPCLTSVRFVQSWALCEIEAVGGLLAGIGVGHGKTILNVIAPLMFPNCRRAVLLLPPNDQFNLISTYRLLAEHYRVPSLVMESRQYATENYYKAGEPVLNVVPYSMLSRPEHTGLLSKLAPDVLIFDEADKVSDLSSSTSMRVLRYFSEAPNTRAAFWSGSLSDKTLFEIGPMSAMSLRYGSPLPLDPDEIKRWGSVIDPVPVPAPMGELVRFCQPGESARQGFARRLAETPGVVLTSEAAVDCELVVSEREAPTIPDVVARALRDVRSLWQRPDGEEFVEITEVQACARQLAGGFYYRWIYPRGEPVELIERWFEARRKWFKAMRWFLKDSPAVHLDSPDLLEKAAMRAWGDAPEKKGLPTWKCEAWPAWRDIRDQVKPKSQTVRLHPFLAEDAAGWARDNLGVVWYADTAFGEWVAEISKLPQHVGGPKAAAIIAREKGDRSIICSTKAHGRGRDGLQLLFDDQLIASPPASAKLWEQLLGRLVRTGQNATSVSGKVYLHTPEYREAVRKALRRAEYAEETLRNKQKLLSGFSLEIEDDE